MKNKKLITAILLSFVILVASVLRLYQLGIVPSSPDWDEVALGYNAYSILTTGRDEYGEFMPIVLRSFDDYKPALYMYFIIPLIPLFGVDIISVRLPSAVLGVLTVLASYFLINELFRRKDIAFLASFLLAISPASIQFSRVAFETNTGVAFNVFGALFFLKGLKKPLFLFLSALFFGINLSIYQSDRVYTPLFALVLIIIYRKQVFAIPRKYLIGAFLVGVIAVLPLATNLITNSKSLYRFKGVSIFSEPTKIKLEAEKRYVDDKNNGNRAGVLFHNKWVAYSREIMSGYLSHYDLNWLFIRGDLARHHAPSVGLMYLWELPFFLMGIYFLVFQKFSIKTKLLIFTWFFLAPVPAAVTTGVPHIVRTLNFLPTFQIFTALGLLTFIIWASNIKFKIAKVQTKYLLLTFCFLLFASNFIYYLNQYFVQQNYFTSYDWQYGYREAVPYVKDISNKYKKIVVSDRVPLDQSHMFFLFYLKYPPRLYQKAGNSSGGFLESHKFDKYEFRPIDWKKEEKNPDILYVGRPQDFQTGGGNILKTINYIDGKPAIIIIEG